jgi:3-oxoacyl-[acyl-carrier protein] reductase
VLDVGCGCGNFRAAVATFLASERASYVTGGVHLVDGGAHVSGREHTYLTAGREDTFR